MTITEAGILFTRATNLHNQLRFITNQDKIHSGLLYKLKKICDSQDSNETRKELQEFIIKHGSTVYNSYSKYLEHSYTLKD